MKHLKTFENFADIDMGRFSDNNSDEENLLGKIREEEEEISELEDELEEEECPCGTEGCPACSDQEEEEEEIVDIRRKVWGDEIIEKKKMNAGFKAYLDKQKDKKSDKKADSKDDKKSDKKEDKKGLTKAQSKLPEGLRKAIEAKKKK